MKKTAVLLTLTLGVAACEQTDQELPFGAANEPVTQTANPQTATTVSTPAGASVTVPSGAVSTPTPVTVTPTPPPASTQQSGTPAAAQSFKIEPAGTELKQPAQIEMKVSKEAAAGENSWLISVVNQVSADRVQELGNATVDASTGIVRTDISTLGTLTAVIPDPSAVVQASDKPLVPEPPASLVAQVEGMRLSTGVSASLQGDEVFASHQRGISVTCGLWRTARCNFGTSISHNVRSKVARAAAIFPSAIGSIAYHANGTASGAITVFAPIRAQFPNRQIVTIPTQMLIQATPATRVIERTYGFNGSTTWTALTNVKITLLGKKPTEITQTVYTWRGSPQSPTYLYTFRGFDFEGKRSFAFLWVAVGGL